MAKEANNKLMKKHDLTANIWKKKSDNIAPIKKHKINFIKNLTFFKDLISGLFI